MAKKQKKFTNLVILDASGSMESKLQEVIGGLKMLFKSIKSDAEKNPKVVTNTIIVDFSDFNDFNVLVESTNPNELTDKIAESYKTRGFTALYDAIGKAFKMIPDEQDGVFINIFTDGQENNSKEFTQETVKQLIAKGRENKWAITFMGTTEADIQTAMSFGVSRGNTMQFTNDSSGVEAAMKGMSLSRGIYYTSTVSNTSIDVDNLMANQ